MVRFLTIVSLAVAGGSGLSAQITTGDAARGEQLVRDRGCTTCHKLNGTGGNKASDLATRRSRNFTPAGLAGVLWSHSPAAWTPTGAQTQGTSALSPEQGADLFAFFSSRRYFDPLGDAKQGRKVFTGKRCASCHGIKDRITKDAPAVATWRSLRDPIGFARDLWNCKAAMDPAYEKKGVHYPRLTAGQMNDLLIYLDNLVGIRSKEPKFELAAGEEGRTEFSTLQCDSCHKAKHSLENLPDSISMAEIQAMMWNHVLTTPRAREKVTYDEMAGLVGYLWSLEPRGDPRRGEVTFTKKGCAACHTDAGKGAPILNDSDLSPVSLVSSLSSHGPAMRAEMKTKGVVWPRIGKEEIADMVAYLRSRHPSVPKQTSSGAVAQPLRLPRPDSSGRSLEQVHQASR
jgi:mono/diheme cytochrome c family protein